MCNLSWKRINKVYISGVQSWAKKGLPSLFKHKI